MHESTRVVRDLSDDELIHQIALRQESALQELDRRYRHRLTAFAIRYWTRSPDLAEEVANDTMLAAWNRASSFEGRSAVSSWLFAIARRHFLKAIRRRVVPTVPLGDGPDAPEYLDARHNPREELDRRRREARVRGHLAQLPGHQAEVLEMSFFLGLSNSEISRRVGLPVGTVKTRIRSAKRRLAERLTS